MAYMNLDTVEGAALLLADVELTVRDNPHSHSGWERANLNWGVTLSCDGNDLDTTFDISLLEPSPIDVLRRCADEATKAATLDIDAFADEMDLTKPSEVISRYETCKKELAWLNDIGVSKADVGDLASTLEEQRDEVQQRAQAIRDQRAAERELANPEPPKGFVTIDSLEADLDLGDYGDQCAEMSSEDYIGDVIGEVADANIDMYNHDLLEWLPDHYEWVEEADANGLLEGCKGDIFKMVQAAQYECFSSDMYDHREDIAKYVTLESLKDEGVYAVSEEVADALMYDIDYSRTDRLSFLLNEAQTLIIDSMDEPLYEALGSNEEILEDGMLHNDYMSIKESGYEFPNPCAMGIETVRAVNKRGYDAVFKEFWGNYMDVSKEEPDTGTPSLGSMAKECRDASEAFGDGGHGGHDDPNR